MTEDTKHASRHQKISSTDGIKPAQKHSTHTPAEPAKMSAELTEIAELKNKNLRLYADMDNLHKQHSIDLDRYKKIGKRAVLDPLVGFLSTLHIAFSYAPETDDEKVIAYISTLKSSFEKLKKELADIGIELVVPTKEQSFDAETMRSLNGTDDEHATVKNVVSIGLRVDGQLTTPATVMV
jgi:molecular chaperone GrpE (heat shock protein)